MNVMPSLPPAADIPRATSNHLESPATPGLGRSPEQAATSAPAPDFPAELARRQPEPESQAVAESVSPSWPLNPPSPLQEMVEDKAPGLLSDIGIEVSGIVMSSPLAPTAEAKIATGDTPQPGPGLPAVLHQGLVVAKQPLVPTEVGQPAPDADASAAVKAGGAVATPTKALPAAFAAAAAPPVVTANGTAAVATAEPLPVTVPAEPAAPAAVWEAASMGRGPYTQAPVVNEAQLVAASLKQNSRPTPGAVTVVGSEQTAAGPEPIVTGSAAQADGEQAAGDPDHLDSPPSGATSTSAPAVELSEQSAIPVAPESASAPAAETDADLAPPTVAVDGAVNASSGATSRPSTVSTGAETHVSRSVRQQVVRQIAGRLETLSGQDKVTIKLNPESLGQLELKFEAREDRLAVVINASGSEAEAALQENLKDLTDRIVERSARFSHVDVRVEIRDSSDPRQDGKQDAKQDGRQDQRRDQGQRDGSEPEHQHHHSRQAQQTQQAWESAMSWHLADQAASEKG